MRADTARAEVLEILKSAPAPMTNPEIFAQCKLVEDRKALADILFQLSKQGHAKRAGEKEQAKGKALAMFVIGDGVAPAAGSAKESKKAADKAKVGVQAKSPGKAPEVPPAAPGFRCGLFSDGSFAIHCKEGALTLQPGESAALFVYVGMLPEKRW